MAIRRPTGRTIERRGAWAVWPLLVLAGCGGAPPGDEPPAEEAPHDWLIVAGTRIGPVDATTSERALIERLGAERVTRREAHIGEGFCATGSALYPETPDEVEVLWVDSTYTAPSAARVSGAGSRWRSREGVGVGTTLAELEQKAGRPIELAGFGWDYGGSASWSEPTDGGESGTIQLRLAPNPDSVARVSDDPTYAEVLGDRMIRSDHPLLRRMDVRVERLTVVLGSSPGEHECAPM